MNLFSKLNAAHKAWRRAVRERRAEAQLRVEAGGFTFRRLFVWIAQKAQDAYATLTISPLVPLNLRRQNRKALAEAVRGIEFLEPRLLMSSTIYFVNDNWHTSGTGNATVLSNTNSGDDKSLTNLPAADGFISLEAALTSGTIPDGSKIVIVSGNYASSEIADIKTGNLTIEGWSQYVTETQQAYGCTGTTSVDGSGTLNLATMNPLLQVTLDTGTYTIDATGDTVEGINVIEASTNQGLIVGNSGANFTIQNNVFTDDSTGVLIDTGGGSGTITDNTFDSTDSTWISNEGRLEVSALDNNFNGVNTANSNVTLAQNFTIDDNILDGLDASNAGDGLVRIEAGNIYVTQSSGSIQRAVSLAQNGDTIYVQGGSSAYVGDVTGNVAVTILGPNDGVDPNGTTARNTEAVVDGSISIDPNGGSVTVSGLTIDSSSTTNAAVSISSASSTGTASVTDDIISASADAVDINWTGTLSFSNSNLILSSTDGIEASNISGSLSITDNTISAESVAVHFSGSGTLSVSGSSLDVSSGDGVDVSGGGGSVSNTTISASGKGVDMDGHGILDISSDTISGGSGVLIENGTGNISDSCITASASGNGTGVQITGGSLTMTGDTVSDFSTGVDIEGGNASIGDGLDLDANTIRSDSVDIVVDGDRRDSVDLPVGDVAIEDNELLSEVNKTPNGKTGLELESISGTTPAPTISDNTISGFDVGVSAFDVEQLLNITGGTIENATDAQGNGVGVFITNTLTNLSGTLSVSAANESVTLSAVTLTGDDTGVLVQDAGGTAPGGGNVSVGFENGVSITGGINGVTFEGAKAGALGGYMADTLINDTGHTISLLDGAMAGQTLDATDATISGHRAHGVPDGYAAEDQIVDYLDGGNVGYVEIDPTTVFVAHSSEDPTLGGSAGAMQRAVNVSTRDGEIEVQAGDYAVSALDIIRGVTIVGAEGGVPGQNTTRGGNGETVFTGPGNQSIGAFAINTTDPVTIEGITLAGSKIVDGEPSGATLTFNDDIFNLLAMAASNQTNMILNTPNLLTLTNNQFTTTGDNPSNSAVIQIVGGFDAFTSNTYGSAVSIINNVFKGVANVTDGQSTLQLNFSDVQGQVSYNTFNGVDIGVLVANTSGNLSIDHNTFENITRGQTQIDQGSFGAGVVFFDPNFSATVSVDSNTFVNDDAAIRTSVGSGTYTLNGVQVNIGVDQSTQLLDLSQPGVAIINNDFGDLPTQNGEQYDPNQYDIVDKLGGTIDLSQAGNTFDGVPTEDIDDGFDIDSGFQVQDKMVDSVDVSGYGNIVISSDTVYVTPSSSFGPGGTNGADIQRAINIASQGETIAIEQGLYVGDVSTIAGQDLTLQISGNFQIGTVNESGTVTLQSGDTVEMKVLSDGEGMSADQLQAFNVTLNGASLQIDSLDAPDVTFGSSAQLIVCNDFNTATGTPPVPNQFSNLPEDSAIDVDGTQFTGFYNGGENGGLTIVALPDSLPTTVYVNETWNGVQFGQHEAGGGFAVGYDQFSTLQQALNAVTPGGTVILAAGTFDPSNILLNFAVTIDGAGEGVSIITPSAGLTDSHDDSSFGGTVSNGFIIASSDVTIENLTIDGGASQNFRDAIITNSANDGKTYSNITIQNVGIENVFRKGIALYNYTGLAGNITVSNVTLNNIGTIINDGGNAYEATAAIAVFGANATISNNTITDSAGGIEYNTFDGSAGNVTIFGNNISLPSTTLANGALGIDAASLAGGSSIGNNTINMSGDTGNYASADIGLVVSFDHGNIAVGNNTITASTGGNAVELYQDAFPVTLSNNTITGNSASGAGVLVTSSGSDTSKFDDVSGPVSAILLSNTISGFGAGVQINSDGTAADTASVTLGDGTAGGSNTISNVNFGVLDPAPDTVVNALDNSITAKVTGVEYDGTGNVSNNIINLTGSGATGMYAQQTSNVTIDNNQISASGNGSLRTGVYAEGSGGQPGSVEIKGNTITAATNYGVDVSPMPSTVTVSNNTISTTGSGATGIYLSGTTSGNLALDVENNQLTSTGIGNDGINLSGTNGNETNTILTNAIAGYATAVYLSGQAGNTTVGNSTISGATQYGINENGPVSAVDNYSNNTIGTVGNAAIGIQADGLSAGNLTLNNNQITNTGNLSTRSGISMGGGSPSVSVDIEGDTISGYATGINSGGIQGNQTISSNTISGVTVDGIIGTPITPNSIISNNTITGCSTAIGISSPEINASCATISNNTIGGMATGIFAIGPVNITDNTLYSNTIGIDLEAFGQTVSGNDFTGGNVVGATPNTTDLKIGGGESGVTIGDGNQFDASATYINNQSSENFDLSGDTSTTFGGNNAAVGDIVGGVLTPIPTATGFNIEDKITDYLDNPSLGFVNINPTNVYVAHSSEDPTLGGTAGSIQRGVNVAASGGTVYVQAGTYIGNATVDASDGYVSDVLINKPLSLIGPNAGFNPTGNTTPANAQAILLPGSSDPALDTNEAVGIEVTSSNVTIEGFTILGSNTVSSNFTHNGNVTFEGVPIDQAEGIVSDRGVGNITVEGNIIGDTDYSGIDFYNYDNGGAPTTNNLITDNLIQNLSDNLGFGVGILVYNNFYAQITDNTITNVLVGIQTGNFDQANPGSGNYAQISDNTIAATGVGIFFNLMYDTTSTFTVQGNDISAIYSASDAPWQGMLITSIESNVGVNFIDNNIDGSNAFFSTEDPSTGYEIWNTPTTGNISISGGNVTGVDYGVWVNSYEGYNGPADATSATISGVSISARQIGVYVEDSAQNGNHPQVSATITGNTTITGGNIGIETSGGNASVTVSSTTISDPTEFAILINGGRGNITNSSIYNNATGIKFENTGSGSFSGVDFTNSGNGPFNGTDLIVDSTAGLVTDGGNNTFGGTTFIENLEGNLTLNATNDSFRVMDSTGNLTTVLASALTLAQAFAVEDKVDDYLDNDADGYVELSGNTVYVAHSSEDTTLGGTAGSIQRGITVSSDPGTLYIQSGNYAGNIDVTKSLDIEGAGLGSTTLFSTSTDPTGGSLGSPVVLIDASNTTLGNLTVNGENPNNSNAIGASTGIITDWNILGSLTNTTIKDVTVENIYERGIEMSNGGSGTGTFDIENDTVNNVLGNPSEAISIFNYGDSGTIANNNITGAADGIATNHSTGTDIYGNTISDAEAGIHSDNNGGSGGTADSIHDNIIESGNEALSGNNSWGIFSFAPYANVSIGNNTISGVDVGLANLGSEGGTTEFSNNSVSVNTGGTGAYVTTLFPGFGDGNTTASFSGDSFTGGDVGIEITEDPGFTASATITNVQINDPATGILVDSGASATISGGNITNNGTGIEFTTGGHGSVSGVDFASAHDNSTDLLLTSTSGNVSVGGNNTFAGSTATIEDQNAATPIDLSGTTGNEFDGISLTPTSSLADLYTIEDSVIDAIDMSGYGLVRLEAGELYVTPNSFISPAANDSGAIQRAINAATPGDTINVEAGTYLGAADINKAVTISGAGDDSTTGTILNFNSNTSDTLSVDSGNVSLSGLYVSGNSGGYGIEFNSTVSNVSISNVTVSGASSGIEIHNSGNVSNLSLTDVSLVNSANGFRLSSSGIVNGLTVTGSHFDNDQYGLYTTATSSSTTNQTRFDDITITDSTFNNDLYKGIYAEVMNDAVLDGVTVDSSGTGASSPNGINLNLKYGTYGNITIENSNFDSDATGSATNAALDIEGRNDAPNYNSNPASLSGVTLTGDTFTGTSPVDVIIANDVTGVSMSGDSLGGTRAGLVSQDTAGGLNVGNTAFAGSLSYYIVNDSPFTIDATNDATFNGFDSGASSPPASLPSDFATEDKIVDAIDVPGLGLVRLHAADVFVTPNSFVAAAGTTAPSIQRGINAASIDDTVYVEAGTYTGQVNANKTITLDGAGAGVNANGRSEDPSIIQSPANGTTELTISASDATVDGFTIEGNTNDNNVGYGVYIVPGVSGTHFDNNIVQDNIAGLALANASATDEAVIEGNLFQNNNNNGSVSGTDIYADQYTAGPVLQNVLIEDNTFTNSTNNPEGVGIGISNTDPAPFQNITIEGNTISNTGQGMYFFNANNVSITSNTIEGAVGSAIALVGDIDTNFTISDNDLNSNGDGIDLFDVLSSNGNVTGLNIHNNNINDNSGDGVNGDGDGDGIYIDPTVTAGSIKINDNSFAGNSNAGIEDDSTVSVDATANWWNSSNGPTTPLNTFATGTSLATGDAVISTATANITIAPWLTSGVSLDVHPGFFPTATLETTTPATPSQPALNPADDSGASNSDGITNVNTPTFTGTSALSDSGDIVTLYDTNGTTVLGTGTVDSTGNWSVTSSTLTEGAHSLTVVITDQSGNQSDPSTADSIFIDSVAPNPTFVAPTTSPEGTAISLTANPGDHIPSSGGFIYDWSVSDDNGQVIADGNNQDFTFTPDDNGNYTVSLTVTDAAGNSGSTSNPISVTNVAPSGINLSLSSNHITEDGNVTLSGNFTDPGTQDTETVIIDWGDSTTSTPDTTEVDLPAGTTTIGDQTHQYLDNPVGQPDGSFTISVTVTDKDGGVGTGNTSVEVDNVAPTPTITGTPITNVPEGSPISFGSTVTDVSPIDQAANFTYSWTVTKNGANYAVSGNMSANFTFTPDDNANYVVTLTATDKDGGATSVSTGNIAVTNVAPSNLNLALTSGNISENGSTDLSGNFTDPGILDTHEVDVNWGDGSAITVVDLAAGVTTFDAGSHTYLDNPAGQPNGSDTISVTVTDKDGASTSGNTSVEVNNVAPSNLNLALSSGNISENGSTDLSGNFTDPGTLDTHTVDINWGDGSADTILNLNAGVTSFGNTAHQYLDNPAGQPNGSFPITVTVTDNDGGSVSGNTSVEVNNVPPTIINVHLSATDIQENGNTGITVNFGDPGTLDTHTVDINWGDGSADSIVSLGADVLTSGNISHQYLDNPAGSPNGNFHITATVTDKDGGSDTIGTSVEVDNVAPSNVNLALSSDNISENGSTDLSGNFTDPGTLDNHIVVVNWGDGSANTTLNLPANVTTFDAGLHTYLDNPAGQPNGSDNITVTVTDKDGGVGTGNTSVEVNNVAPSNLNLALTSGNISENQSTDLSGNFTDPGTLDSHIVVVNWGDGSANTTLYLPANVTTFDAGLHSYLDNPAGQPNGSDTISITVTDKDGASTSGNTSVEVNNVAPSNLNLALSSGNISENGSTDLSGNFTDPGTLDTHTVVINWGDGSANTTLNLLAGVTSFDAGNHQYLDNPAGQPNGNYTISVIVTDKDGASTSGNTSVEVNNVAPSNVNLQLTQIDISEDGSTSLSGNFTEPGTQDTETVVINWGDSTTSTPDTTSFNLAAGVTTFSGETHQFLDNPVGQPEGSFPITVTVTDKDGGVGTGNTSVEVNNVAPTPTITGAPTTSVPEGSPISFGSTVIDVSPVDQAAGFNYLWTVTKNGVNYPVTSTTSANFTFTPDNNANYVVTLTATDKDGGSTSVSTGNITVTNVAPSNLNLSITPGTINENGNTTLSGNFTDPGFGDTHIVSINWGDGSAIQNVPLSAGVLSLGNITHQYLQNNPGNAPFTIGVTVTDQDGASTSGNTSVIVDDVPPTIALSAGSVANEGSAFTLDLGAITDPGTLDVVTSFKVNWGDGSPIQNVTGNPANTTLNHTYADGPANDTIQVSLSDQDGQHNNAGTLIVHVNNVAPTATVTNDGTVDEGDSTEVEVSNIFDPSSVDTAAGIHIAYDFNDDGTFDVGNGTYAGSPAATADETVPNSFLLTPGVHTVDVRVIDKDGGSTDYLTSFNVDNVAPIVNIAPTDTASAGSLFTYTSNFTDPGNDSPWTGTVNYGDGTGNQALTIDSGNKTFTLSHTYATSGNYSVTLSITDTTGQTGPEFGPLSGAGNMTVNVQNTTLRVNSVTTTGDGFDITFNRAIDIADVALYGSGNVTSPISVQLGNTTINGSLVWVAGTDTAHWIKTGGNLGNGNYTLTLVSGATGDNFHDANNNALDGNSDNVPGDNFVDHIAVANPVVLSIPNFARGPDQGVLVSLGGTQANATGLPIMISDGTGVQSVHFVLNYDPTLLNINTAVQNISVPSGFTFTINPSTVGHLDIVVYATGTATLGAGQKTVLTFKDVNVPDTAPTGAADAMYFSSVLLNESLTNPIASIGAETLHKVVDLGDTTNSGIVGSEDAFNISRITVHLDTGFASDPLTDPVIIGDLTGDGTLSGLDANAASLMSTNSSLEPQVPNPVFIVGGAVAAIDPTVQSGLGNTTTINTAVGSTVTTSVSINDDASGLTAADLTISFDPSLLSITDANVQLSTQLTNLGWGFTESVGTGTNGIALGTINVGMFSTSGPLTSGPATLFNLTFTAGNTDGVSQLNVAPGKGNGLNKGALTMSTDIGSITVNSAVTGEHVFYAGSFFDQSSNPNVNADDNAIAPDKSPLLPGQTASFSNYTSYSLGLNGIMVDIAGSVGNVTASDFSFLVGGTGLDGNDFSTWTALSGPAPTVTLRPTPGVAGSTRITLLFANNEIQNEWLQVTVLATTNTGLAANSVFYFGNAIGETGNDPNADAKVTAADEIGARSNPVNFQSAPITDPYDFNRDGNVNAEDQIIARSNITTSFTALDLITAPGGSGNSASVSTGNTSSTQTLSLTPVLTSGSSSSSSETASLAPSVDTTSSSWETAPLTPTLTADPTTTSEASSAAPAESTPAITPPLAPPLVLPENPVVLSVAPKSSSATPAVASAHIVEPSTAFFTVTNKATGKAIKLKIIDKKLTPATPAKPKAAASTKSVTSGAVIIDGTKSTTPTNPLDEDPLNPGGQQ